MTNRCAFGVVMLFSFLLLACQPIVRPTDVVSPLDGPATVEIPFETISLNETGEGIRDSTVTEETQLLLLTTPEQVHSLKTMVNSEDFAQLQQVDFTADAVIALFRGWRGSHNYQTIIEQITQEKEHLRVHAQFWEPSPYWASAEEITYPYHLVKIHKGDLPSRQVELELEPVTITPTPPANVKD